MSIIIQFGKIVLNDKISTLDFNKLINIHSICDVKWNKYNNKMRFTEEFFTENSIYGYELLLCLRPYYDDGKQIIFISDDILTLIENVHNEVKSDNKKYIKYAIWLLNIAKLCRKTFNSKAFIATYYQ